MDFKNCKHNSGLIIDFDYSICKECHGIKTRPNKEWGIAKNLWFESVYQAQFYKEHGVLPESLKKNHKEETWK